MRNSDSEYGLLLLTLGLENERTPSSSGLDSSVAARNRFAAACGYGITIVGMQDQWLLVALTEIGDVPAPQLVWAVSPQAQHCSRCLRRTYSPSSRQPFRNR